MFFHLLPLSLNQKKNIQIEFPSEWTFLPERVVHPKVREQNLPVNHFTVAVVFLDEAGNVFFLKRNEDRGGV
ncbi:MAG: hypothetical protein JW774_04770 [Candidatus Aureabacteria bacterium]|nr:hypothetical protein [Candidatus Auribacterota bacterium]